MAVHLHSEVNFILEPDVLIDYIQYWWVTLQGLQTKI